MKTEEQYHIDWLSLNEGLLSSDETQALSVFIHRNPRVCEKWEKLESDMNLIRSINSTFSNTFNSKVLLRMKLDAIPILDKSSIWIASIGVAASILLIFNLCLTQSTWGFDALLGIADMDTNNTSLLFYINS